jgi:hypothetical protein
MGIVTEYLAKLIEKQVEENGIVVWYDPEKHYGEVARNLDRTNAMLLEFTDSFFGLRQQLEPYLEQMERPKLVVYLPLAPESTRNALAEVEAYGVVMKPGMQPRERNTRLAVLAKAALKGRVPDDQLLAIEKQVEAGQLTLEDLNQLGEQKGAGLLSLIFRTTDPLEIALAFLVSECWDQELAQRKAEPELKAFLAKLLGMTLPSDLTLAASRQQAIRWVLFTDFLISLKEEIPAALASLYAAKDPGAIQTCYALAKAWRQRTDLSSSYAEAARTVEAAIPWTGIAWTLEQLRDSPTFPAAEEILQRLVEKSLDASVEEELLVMADTHSRSLWSRQNPQVQKRWELIRTCGELIVTCQRVERESSQAADARTLFQGYTEGETPWCLMDTGQRMMERLLHWLDLEGETDSLLRLVMKARTEYQTSGGKLADRFLRALRDGGWQNVGLPSQRSIFPQCIAPDLGKEKVGYFLVDALRFEMARELGRSLESDFTKHLQAFAATPPTLTEVGMAALLPRAEVGFCLEEDRGKLQVSLNGTRLRDRTERIAYLQKHVPGKVVALTLGELFPQPKKNTKDEIRAADLVLVTSQEIDQLCESGQEHLARKTMDTVLEDLSRAVRMLASLGVRKMVIAADHGYLFGEELSEGMKVEPPGGETVALHRRAWVGRGGAASEGYLRLKLAHFDLSTDLEIALPWGFAGFKAGGGLAYFHGGLSLPELVVPVISLESKSAVGAAPKGLLWKMTPGSPKISTRFFSLTVGAEVTGLFPDLPRVRVEVRDNAQVISRAVSASYGFDPTSGEIELKLDPEGKRFESNTVTLLVEPGTGQRASIHLLDARTGAELTRLEPIEIAIAI